MSGQERRTRMEYERKSNSQGRTALKVGKGTSRRGIQRQKTKEIINDAKHFGISILKFKEESCRVAKGEKRTGSKEEKRTGP